MRGKITSVLVSLILTVYVFISPVTVSSDAVKEMDALVAAYNKTCAVMVVSEECGTLYSYNPYKAVFCASVIKLPYAVYVCSRISSGYRSLNDTIVYTSSWYHGGSGVIRYGGYGKTYTVRQLLDYMLRYSDNVAYDMLVYLFGTDGFNSMTDSWGYNIHLGTPSPRWPYINASFMVKSMQEMSRHSGDGECWKVAWKALNESTDVLVRGVLGNEETPVAIKYGLVEYVYHEVCFIDGENPYTLVILSGASNYNCDEKFVKSVAACAGKIVAEYFPGKKLLGEAASLEKTEPGPLGEAVSLEKIKADINNDYIVDSRDYLILKNYLIKSTDSESQPENADVNGDGRVDILDLSGIMHAIINK